MRVEMLLDSVGNWVQPVDGMNQYTKNTQKYEDTVAKECLNNFLVLF